MEATHTLNGAIASLQNMQRVALLCTGQGCMPVIFYVALRTLLIRKACNEALYLIEELQLTSCWAPA